MINQQSKGMNITLWILQVLFGGMFIMAGFAKISQPIEELAKTLPWADQMPLILVRFIGSSELLGGLGLILPSLLRIKPILTPLAAAGLAIIMILASIFHISRGEMSAIGINFFVLCVAAFIAWGRAKKAVIEPKV